MKVIAVAAVTAGGKTTVVNKIKKRLPRCTSLHFDDYSFAGEVEDFHQWVLDGADYNVWDLSPLKADIEKASRCGKYDFLLLDYPFAYLNDMIRDYIDCAVFIDTPLDIAMARRVLRDMKDASAEEIREEMDVYLNYARIAYVRMLETVLPSSDYVVDGSRGPDSIADEIMGIITGRLGLSLFVPDSQEGKSGMVEVKFYATVDDALRKFAVIIARSNGKWVFCKHKNRSTYEIPGGHREPGEAILETARRELYEETGALEYSLTPVCVYSVTAPDNFDGQETFGMVYFADIQRFENDLHSEIEKIILTGQLVDSWTYPLIQPKMIAEAQRRGIL